MKADDNPRSEPLRGGSPARVAKRLFLATRPMFLTVSILPVLLGTAWGVRVSGSLDLITFALALAATLCVHAAVNVINDVCDDICGSDPINEDRIYPFTGGSRFIQNGIMARGEMLRWGLFLLAAAAVLGVGLAALKGLAVIGFGLAGIALGVLYSAPPVLLAARGVGELAVGVGFGALPVAGAAWLQSGILDWEVMLIALPVSCWVFNIVLINEIPDEKADREAGKRTLVVRFGPSGAVRVYSAANALAFLGLGAAVVRGLLPALALILPGVLMLAAFHAARGLRGDTPGRGVLTAAIKTTLTIHATGALWLIAFAGPW